MSNLIPSGSQTRGGEYQRTGEYPALSEDLFDRVFEKGNMRQAWKQVKANKGAPGVDGITIKAFLEYGQAEWPNIKKAILSGNYQPQPVRRVHIDKEDGSKRLIGIANVQDRIIQQAIAQVLGPIYDPGFSDASWGFRPGRSGHGAIHQLQNYIQQGYTIAVDVDLSKFFDRINHDMLMSLLGRKIRDKRLLRLIAKFLRAGVNDNGTLLESREGVPQGGPLSPLLSNIVLDLLDRELEARGHKFARYADDFVILVKSQRAGERVLSNVTRFVERRLKLKVNDQKSQVVPVKQCKFLGFSFKGKKIVLHPKSIEKFKLTVRRLTGRSWGVSMKQKLKELRLYMRGWFNYFGIGCRYQWTVDLDQWIRRRVRMCYWKQWRKPRTKVRNLLKLGVPKKLAIFCGITSKGYWHSARTEGIQRGLNNEWLKEQGLISLRDQWTSLHYG